MLYLNRLYPYLEWFGAGGVAWWVEDDVITYRYYFPTVPFNMYIEIEQDAEYPYIWKYGFHIFTRDMAMTIQTQTIINANTLQDVQDTAVCLAHETIFNIENLYHEDFKQ